ncbi:PREDICTED: uncharacterized protein LOC109147681 isoform X2 [Ipomoea nil]|uniref:uncharacterized protein LOC109147681 isoform X2 n=1 Tax=Ipomoea nil TaxID=35883 RepID=UPI000901A878|nr:PREDICTED: uncharacterized protein LOC109147681 isoform X2 [Ipomoea nil]
MALSGHAIQLTLRPKARGSHRPPLFPPLKPWRPELQAFKRRGMMKNIPLRLVTSAAISSGFGTGNVGSDSSLLQTIKAFYYSINTKDSKSLKVLLSEDCFFDDFSFPAPFQGKKESLYFLEQLTTCMGQNMEFSIDHICEGVDQTAVVNWHLEWKKKQVPFTRGCSYYELSREGERLVIKKAQVIIESPVKPGGLALTMFKAITSLFDAFPDATERFLRSPNVMFQLLLNIYKTVLGPMLSPVVSWYIKLMKLTATFLNLAFKVVQFIVKIFSK